MKRIPALLALAAPALLLVACGTPDEEDLMARADDIPAAATPLEDRAPSPEAGRPALEAAMRNACPSAGLAAGECRATEVPNQFACQYELIDGERNQQYEVTLVRSGDEWTLAEIPAHCTTEAAG